MDLVPPVSESAPSHLHSSSSSGTSFPIIAIAIIGILATAFLLVSYYIFVIKCCLNWHRIDLLRRFSLSRDTTNHHHPLTGYSPPLQTRGLDDSVIRSIPIFNFKKVNTIDFGERSFCECAVCLNEFQQDEKLRIIPNCSHVFHIDCIDIWLQNNANCPLCRNTISTTSPFHPINIMAPQDPNPTSTSTSDEAYVVIDLGSHNSADSGQVSSARSVTPKIELKKKSRKYNKVNSMGDECIDIRGKDEQFAAIQPMRRSFSMDSSADRHLYLSIQQNTRQVEVEVEGCSRPRRNFFSFRGSRSSILPLHLYPE
ncbi:RING-H2 finger protein ATL16 [Euphorbia lathyris]|uniref:RING-H2 finger protein ATL16 n=1 Tax=Euphorbia lathyris TaxID=212925 RepID=UPI003313D6A1